MHHGEGVLPMIQANKLFIRGQNRRLKRSVVARPQLAKVLRSLLAEKKAC